MSQIVGIRIRTRGVGIGMESSQMGDSEYNIGLSLREIENSGYGDLVPVPLKNIEPSMIYESEACMYDYLLFLKTCYEKQRVGKVEGEVGGSMVEEQNIGEAQSNTAKFPSNQASFQKTVGDGSGSPPEELFYAADLQRDVGDASAMGGRVYLQGGEKRGEYIHVEDLKSSPLPLPLPLPASRNERRGGTEESQRVLEEEVMGFSSQGRMEGLGALPLTITGSREPNLHILKFPLPTGPMPTLLTSLSLSLTPHDSFSAFPLSTNTTNTANTANTHPESTKHPPKRECQSQPVTKVQSSRGEGRIFSTLQHSAKGGTKSPTPHKLSEQNTSRISSSASRTDLPRKPSIPPKQPLNNTRGRSKSQSANIPTTTTADTNIDNNIKNMWPGLSHSHVQKNMVGRYEQLARDVEVEKVEVGAKERIFSWLIDISLLQVNKINIPDLPKYCQNGVLFANLLNRLEGKHPIIKGINRKPKNASEVIANLRRVFDYLRQFEKMNSRYLWAHWLIVEGYTDVIWGLLDDIWYFYHKKLNPHDTLGGNKDKGRNREKGWNMRNMEKETVMVIDMREGKGGEYEQVEAPQPEPKNQLPKRTKKPSIPRAAQNTHHPQLDTSPTYTRSTTSYRETEQTPNRTLRDGRFLTPNARSANMSYSMLYQSKSPQPTSFSTLPTLYTHSERKKGNQEPNKVPNSHLRTNSGSGISTYDQYDQYDQYTSPLSTKERGRKKKGITIPLLREINEQTIMIVREWLKYLNFGTLLTQEKEVLLDNPYRNGVLLCELVETLDNTILEHKISNPQVITDVRINFQSAFRALEESKPGGVPDCYVAHLESMIKGDRKAVWGLLDEIRRLYPSTQMKNQHFFHLENTGLPYSIPSIRKLEISIISFLYKLGFLRDVAFPHTIMDFETHLTTGVLLAEVVQAVCGVRITGIFKTPKVESTCVSNIRKCLNVLRRCSKMRQKYTWSEREIAKGERGRILGLLEDIHRFYDGLPPKAHVAGPYLGQNVDEEPVLNGGQPFSRNISHFNSKEGLDTRTPSLAHTEPSYFHSSRILDYPQSERADTSNPTNIPISLLPITQPLPLPPRPNTLHLLEEKMHIMPEVIPAIGLRDSGEATLSSVLSSGRTTTQALEMPIQSKGLRFGPSSPSMSLSKSGFPSAQGRAYNLPLQFPPRPPNPFALNRLTDIDPSAPLHNKSFDYSSNIGGIGPSPRTERNVPIVHTPLTVRSLTDEVQFPTNRVINREADSLLRWIQLLGILTPDTLNLNNQIIPEFTNGYQYIYIYIYI